MPEGGGNYSLAIQVISDDSLDKEIEKLDLSLLSILLNGFQDCIHVNLKGVNLLKVNYISKNAT